MCKIAAFSRVFTQIFLDNFSREIKVVNSYKVQNYSIFTSFHPTQFDNFSREIKVEFQTTNEDFEQCERKSTVNSKILSRHRRLASTQLNYDQGQIAKKKNDQPLSLSYFTKLKDALCTHVVYFQIMGLHDAFMTHFHFGQQHL